MLRPPRWPIALIAVLGTAAVVVSWWMVTTGFRDSTTTEHAKLVLAPLPLALAIVIGCAVSLIARRSWRRHAALIVISSVAALVGLVGYLILVIAGGSGLLFQALMWLGVGAVFCVVGWEIVRGGRVVTRSPRLVQSLAELESIANRHRDAESSTPTRSVPPNP